MIGITSSLSAYPLAHEFALAAKQLLCFECRRYRCRLKGWASQILDMLDMRRD
ncbi:unnamed protein product [Penicillium roqueforti FM164]|uniref:Uncharacterized protein n=1 Tax=Penicillium roqueforti (strain FM164) TaxID=1365484 RepID=W6QWD5_PENRF|nr:unnamed protein product [Penicillium roqueforti FM164]